MGDRRPAAVARRNVQRISKMGSRRMTGGGGVQPSGAAPDKIRALVSPAAGPAAPPASGSRLREGLQQGLEYLTVAHNDGVKGGGGGVIRARRRIYSGEFSCGGFVPARRLSEVPSCGLDFLVSCEGRCRRRVVHRCTPDAISCRAGGRWEVIRSSPFPAASAAQLRQLALPR